VTSAERSSSRRPPWQRPGLLAAALVVALGGLLLLSERHTGFSVDEGSYAIQAEAIHAGGWSIHWPFRDLDPDGRFFPYHAGELTSSGEVAYAAHPTWPALLSLVQPVGGPRLGLRVLSLGSVVASAVIAFHLARRLAGARAAPWAFGLVAASPVLPNGFAIWAHASSAALAGLAVLAAVELVLGARPAWWVPILAGSLALGALVRSEGLLFAGALCLALWVTGWQRTRSLRSPLVACGLAAATVTAAAVGVERLWRSDILGGAAAPGLHSRSGGSSSSWFAGRLSGLASSLLDGSVASPSAALTSAVCLCLVVLAAVAVLRPGLPRPALLLGAAAGAAAVRIWAGHTDAIPGLLMAMPFVGLAGVGLAASELRSPAVRPAALVVIGSGVVFGAAVLVTQYDDGGGLQWGGRYFSPILVPLCVLAAAGAAHPRLAARSAQAGLLALALATGVGGFVITDQVRRVNTRAIDLIAAQGNEVVVIDDDQRARLDWERWPDRRWLAANGDLDGVVALLRSAHVERATFVLLPVDDVIRAGATPVGDPPAGATVFSADIRATNMRSQVGTDG
jgi:hypothetical protein